VRAGSGPAGAYVVTIASTPEARAIGEAGLLTLVVATVLLVPAAIATWLLAGRVVAPLGTMRATTRAISESDLDGRIPTRHEPDSLLWDELDDLATTMNAMLARLDVAFHAQRRFVDEAGHELRTPLTVVRGHLELMDDDPAARAETLDLVVDELDRMGRLVADLQTLTKSTQPAFLHPAPVDLSVLTDVVLSRARGLGDRDWRLDGAAEVVVLADRQRLVQALLQLVSNAVAQTAPGDTIAVGSRVDGDEVVLWVRDSGPGVPPEARDRLFDRFVHGEASDGSGLGLSIVEAIARAHGGRAALLDPGPGSTRFGLLLPERRPEPGSR
jgi:signal transduction histidine kinase